MKDKDFDNVKRPDGKSPRQGRLFLTNLTEKQSNLIKTSALTSSGISLGAILSKEVISNIIAKSYNNAEDAKSNILEDLDSNQDHGEKATINIKAHFADKVNDNMNFQEAFGTARGEMGPGAFFEWRESIYNTYYKDEWATLPDSSRGEYWSNVIENADYQSLEIIGAEEDTLNQESNIENLQEQNFAQPVDDLNDLDKDIIPEALEQEINEEELTDVIIAELDYDGMPRGSNPDWENDAKLDTIVIEEDPFDLGRTEVNIEGNFNMDDFLEIEDEDEEETYDPQPPKTNDLNIDYTDDDEEDFFETL